MTLKIPQMFQLGNYGLALFHSFQTKATLAILHGWSVLSNTNHVTQEKTIPHAERIEELIRSTVSLWNHPLLLPALMLEEHLYRAETFKAQDLSYNTALLEARLGVVKSAHLPGSVKFGPKELKELMRNEDRRVELTTMLNSTITDTINFTGNLKWDHLYCKFLRQTCHQIEQFQMDSLMSSNRELIALVDSLECAACANSEHAEMLKSRLNLQLNVV